jgi:hypothetical protein
MGSVSLASKNEGFKQDDVDEILDDVFEQSPEPPLFGDGLLRWWMLAPEAVERRSSVLAEDGPILTIIRVLRVAPLSWLSILKLDGLVGGD